MDGPTLKSVRIAQTELRLFMKKKKKRIEVGGAGNLVEGELVRAVGGEYDPNKLCEIVK